MLIDLVFDSEVVTYVSSHNSSCLNCRLQQLLGQARPFTAQLQQTPILLNNDASSPQHTYRVSMHNASLCAMMQILLAESCICCLLVAGAVLTLLAHQLLP